jgi:hypothetical protein
VRVDGIAPSLRVSVDVSVVSGMYSHISLDVGHVRIFVGTHIAFLFGENPPCMELGLRIVVVGASYPHVGASHPLRGINNYNLMLSLEGVPKLVEIM